ncbi:MAG: hypothetical protein J6X55_12300, partial [Victivallales bacterium]|nr:hypothetical protein [Victivallales bacterium]
MMTLKKKIRRAGMALFVGALLASPFADAQKWNVNDWDDDGVLDTLENAVERLDPSSGPLAADRALVLSTVAANGITLPMPLRFNPTSAFTVEFWYAPVKRVSDNFYYNNGTFLTFGDDTTSSKYELKITDGVISATITNNKVDPKTSVTVAMSSALADDKYTTDITDVKWTHVALVWKKESGNFKLELIIDGSTVATSEAMAPLSAEEGTPVVRLASGFGHGYLDEFRFWSKAKTADEIAADKDAKAWYQSGTIYKLQAYYRFDDGGETLEDYVHLPDVSVAATLNPLTESDKLDELFKYRLMQGDADTSAVSSTSLYTDAAHTILWSRGMTRWVTALPMTVPEIAPVAGVDTDSDGYAGDIADLTGLSDSNMFALVRVANASTTELFPVPHLSGTNTIIYDSNGRRLWVLNSAGGALSQDPEQNRYGNPFKSERAFAEALSTGEADFTDDIDNDSDGIINDTAIAKALTVEIEPSTSADTDTDGDGMPDWWEDEYSLDKTNPNDAALDDDNDGVCNLFEYLCGMDPTNPNTKNRILYVMVGGTYIKVHQVDTVFYQVNEDGTDGTAVVPDEGNEVADLSDGEVDYDGDGIANANEKGIFYAGNILNSYNSQPNLYDTDDDGVNDYDEIHALNTDSMDALDPALSRVLDLVTAAHDYKTPGANGAVVTANPQMAARLAPYAKVADYNALTDLRNYTIELWFNLKAGNTGTLLRKTLAIDKLGDYCDFILYLENGTLKFDYTRVATQANSPAFLRKTASYSNHTFSNEDGWTHVAVTVKTLTEDVNNYSYSITFTAYANAVEFDAQTITDSGRLYADPKPGDLLIGDGFDATAASRTALSLMVDEVRIWSVARESSDIIENRRTTMTTETGLVTNFTFDDGGKTADWLVISQVSGNKNISIRMSATLERQNEAVAEAAEANYGYAMMNIPVDEDSNEVDPDDTDGDGMLDTWEIGYFGNIEVSNGTIDSDKDGLNDLYEYLAGTNPTQTDTDGNGISDAEEDSDSDGLSNVLEQRYGTRPNNGDTDDDGLTDNNEINPTGVNGTGGATGPLDPLDPPVWRALRGNGIAADALVIPEADRLLGHDFTDALSQDWTVEAWFMPSDSSKLTGSIIQRTATESGTTKYYFDMGLNNGIPYVRASIRGMTTPLSITASNGIVARANIWTHYAATWNASLNILTLYINGVFAGSTFTTGDGLVNGGSSSTGFVTRILGECDGEYLAGYVDEVRVWTNTSEGRRGLRLPKQIREYMAKMPKVKLDGDELNDYTALPTAYYRFDDGGTYAEDFAYSVKEDMFKNWPHALLTSDGTAKADLSSRMLSSWSTDSGATVDGTTADTWKAANGWERAVSMNASGDSEFDPIPTGWKQVYWAGAEDTFGVEPGIGYDINQNWLFEHARGNSHNVYDVPQQFPAESSDSVDPLTGETIYNGQIHSGAQWSDSYVYFTDVFVENLSAIDTAVLNYGVGGLPEGDSGKTHIMVFVNAERDAFLNNGSTQPGGLLDHDVNPDFENTSNTTAISGSFNIKGKLVKGRNRITVWASFVNSNTTCTTAGHDHYYSFSARIRINNQLPDNFIGHVKWFYIKTSPCSRGVIPSILYINQETDEICHAKESNGTNKLYLWFEKNYAIYPWGYDQDPDGDGLDNWGEYLANTNPLEKDVAGDGRTDDEMDNDGDLFINSIEMARGTMPNMADTDDDGQDDYYEANNGSDPLNGRNAFQRDNLVLNLNGTYVLTVPENGDPEEVIEELDDWTIQAWVKLTQGLPEAGKKFIIVRRTTGRYAAGDVTNYELGITDEGLPYAGFSTANSTGTKVTDIFAKMTTANLYTPFTSGNDAEWYQVTAVFKKPDAAGKGGQITLYVYDKDGNLTEFTRSNIAMNPIKTMTGLGGITIGGKLPGNTETMDGDTVLDGAFKGQIDNLAIWNKALSKNEINNNSNSLTTKLDGISHSLFYNLKVPIPSYRIDSNIVHAYMFDDGGQTIEDMAFKGDWYNGHAHGVPAPVITGKQYRIYETVNLQKTNDSNEPLYYDDDGEETTTVTPNPVYIVKTDEKSREIHDADDNPVYVQTDAPGIINVLSMDISRSDDNSGDSDKDGLPDNWEIKYWGNLNQTALDDPDGDGLYNIYEYYAGTNPTKTQTVEGTDDVTQDPDEDTLNNYEEQMYATHPNDPDTDDDGVTDKNEILVGRDPLTVDG